MKKAVRVLMVVLMVMMFSSLAAADITYETQWSVDNPSGIAVGPSNYVYVASATNNLVQVYDSSGNFLTQWIVNNPTTIAVNSADDVYVASATNNLVQVYDSSGNFLTQWIVNNPTAIAVNSADDVYVASATNNLVQVYDSSGNFLTQWIVNNPTAIAVNSADDVYVADVTGNLITVFDSNGGYLNQWDVAIPSGLSADPSGNIFVADFNYNFVLVYARGGSYLDQWGNAGTGEMQFAGPASIAINQAGNVYVADMGNDRVQSFLISHTITSTTGANGTISPLGTVTKNSGSSQTYTTIPDAGYRVAGVAVDGWNLGSITSYTFSNITMNHTISATFELNIYTITSTTGANGNISPLGTMAKNSGSSQTYTITPGAGYRVAGVMVDGFNLGAITSYTFSNVTMKHTISAAFALDNVTYTITSTTGANGNISPLGTVTKNPGSSQTYTITPGTGYRVAGVVVDGWNLGAITSYTFNNITMKHTISAAFALNIYTITSTTGANGAISPLGTVAKNSGSSQTYTITPNAGYRVAGVVVDGFNLGAITSYTFNNITMNHTISAAFALNNVTYTITSTTGANGAISPLGTVTKNPGSSQTYTITPGTGYRVASVVVDGWNLGAITSYTFNNVTMKHTISATFVLNSYTITASAGANGAISPSGAVNVNAGSSRAFTAMPNTGYRVANMIVDGFNLGSRTSYTFSNINMKHTISVTFTQ